MKKLVGYVLILLFVFSIKGLVITGGAIPIEMNFELEIQPSVDLNLPQPTNPVSGSISWEATSITDPIFYLTSINLTINDYNYGLSEVSFMNNYLGHQGRSIIGGVTHTTTSIQGGTEHILLVDNEKAIIEMEQNMLERLGYQVTTRISSIDTCEAFKAKPSQYDMVITDMQMPNMAGDKLAIELIKIRPDIPILLCTGFSEMMLEEKAASIGIKGILLKPIVMKDLSHKIREVLDKNQT